MAGSAAAAGRNEVVLIGRVPAPPAERTLPSGDVLLSWRLVVDRPASRRPVPEGTRAVTVDTIDCVAWAGGVRRTAGTFAAGDVVRVEGSLRRRFWRGGGGLGSRYEVEVATAKRLQKARSVTARPVTARPVRVRSERTEHP